MEESKQNTNVGLQIAMWGDTLENIQAEAAKKMKRNWENAFQRWSNKHSQDGTTPLGCCGYGGICDYCEDNHIGRPCVRALNAKAREKRIDIDYNDRNFERWFYL